MSSSTYNTFRKVAVLLLLTAIPPVTSDDTNNFDICDMTGNHEKFRDGILGEVGEFPWIGVLKVPIKMEDQPLAIAATGAVLVTVKHVVVNADDLSKTSHEKLRLQGTVHFVPTANNTYTSKLKNFVIHPEYEYATLNTLGLVELESDIDYDDEDYRAIIKPACLPGIALNTSNALYVTGFTDERMLLEKVLHSSQYVPRKICNEFYDRKYLKADKMQEPKNYVCTFAINKKEICKWDNGMVLLSNITGHWTFVGLGVAGPGCSAPTRFIDMSAYIDWIQSSTRDPDNYDYYGGRHIVDGY